MKLRERQREAIYADSATSLDLSKVPKLEWLYANSATKIIGHLRYNRG